MFKNRKEAGRKLAESIIRTKGERFIIYALPRGGVPVAYEIASRFSAPLDVLIVKKVGVPGDEELALGAVTEGDPPAVFWNSELVRYLRYDTKTLESLTRMVRDKITLLQNTYRHGESILKDTAATALIVDDGIATGATVKAAVNFLRGLQQKRIVVAVPVVEASVASEIEPMVDDLVCVKKVMEMYSVGEFYSDFRQVTEDEVTTLILSMRDLLDHSGS